MQQPLPSAPNTQLSSGTTNLDPDEWLAYEAIDRLYRLGWQGVWIDCERIYDANSRLYVKVGPEATALYRAGIAPAQNGDTSEITS